MFKKIIFTVSFILFSLSGTAQKDINNYKYIIIPKKYDFAKSEDQYQLNSLTKFLFNKYGYEAYFTDEEFPEDLKNDRCLALISEVSNEKKSMFKTKLEIVLKDCFGNAVITSRVGESRLKKFDKAYNQALRDAFETFQNLEYKYVPKETTKAKTIESDVKAEKEDEVETAKIDNSKKVKEKFKSAKEMSSKDLEATNEKLVIDKKSKLYYAQAIEQGYQLVDSEPKVIMVLLNTAANNVFIVKDKNAIVFKEDGFWYYSENNGKLGEKKLMNIKF